MSSEHVQRGLCTAETGKFSHDSVCLNPQIPFRVCQAAPLVPQHLCRAAVVSDMELQSTCSMCHALLRSSEFGHDGFWLPESSDPISCLQGCICEYTKPGKHALLRSGDVSWDSALAAIHGCQTAL